MVNPTTPQALLSQFVASADQVAAAVKGLSDKELDMSCAPDQWTIRQIVHHITDVGGEWNSCIIKGIATPGVTVRFEGYPGNEAWANALKFQDRPIDKGLVFLKANYQFLADLLEHFPDAWDQTVVIRGDGGEAPATVRISDIIKMLTDHIQEHLREIEAIKTSQRPAKP